MAEEEPKRLKIPRSRRLTIDVLHYHQKVPTCAHDRICELEELTNLRNSVPVRISWSIMFIKAYALVAEKYPLLRQTYMRWPWPHLYQHPYSVAMMVTERELEGERWLFWSKFNKPEKKSLLELQTELDRYLTAPAKKKYRQQWQLSWFPTSIRRIIWWWTLNVSGQRKAKHSGTCFLTTLAGKNTEIQHPPAFLTGNFTYGPLDDQGQCRLTLAYDHRIMDGSFIADCLEEIESNLKGIIADELRSLSNDRSRQDSSGTILKAA